VARATPHLHAFPTRRSSDLNVGMIDLGEMMGKAFGKKPTKRRKLKVPDAWDKLVDEEADKRMDQDDVARVALVNAETNGIVFLRSEEHTSELQSRENLVCRL